MLKLAKAGPALASALLHLCLFPPALNTCTQPLMEAFVPFATLEKHKVKCQDQDSITLGKNANKPSLAHYSFNSMEL